MSPCLIFPVSPVIMDCHVTVPLAEVSNKVGRYRSLILYHTIYYIDYPPPHSPHPPHPR